MLQLAFVRRLLKPPQLADQAMGGHRTSMGALASAA
jgi:hypothetical protein